MSCPALTATTHHTYVKAITFNYRWTIHDFGVRPEGPGKCIQSSVFSLRPNQDDKWQFMLFPKGISEEKKGIVSTYLILKSDHPVGIRMIAELSIIGANNQKYNTYKWIRMYDKRRPHGTHHWITRQYLATNRNLLLPNNTLTLHCDLTLIDADNNREAENQFREIPSQLTTNLESALKDPKFSDITFEVGSRKFQAHRSTLASRSPVFATMFKYEKDVVQITDIEPEIFQEMLCFVYTDRALKIQEKANELLAVAEKYELDRLKSLCEPIVFKGITTENCAEMLIQADRYRAAQLKAAAIGFFASHSREVMKSAGYKVLEKNHANLLTEIIAGMEPKNRKRKFSTS